jgi:hypothetical protein
MHVNIRSLLPKFVLFTALAHSTNPNVQAVSESWFRKATKNAEISLSNYNIFHEDRTAKGGGDAIYSRDSLQSSVMLSKSVPKQFELLLLKIHLSRIKSLTVAACYSTPQPPAVPWTTNVN